MSNALRIGSRSINAAAVSLEVCFVNKKSPKSEGKFPSFVLGIPQFRKVA